jgi:hypothetical protein
MTDLAECVDGLPNICGSEERIRQAIQAICLQGVIAE